jgi:hypothetical protein
LDYFRTEFAPLPLQFDRFFIAHDDLFFAGVSLGHGVEKVMEVGLVVGDLLMLRSA